MSDGDSPQCPDCGAEVDPTDVYCSACGAQCRITGSADGPDDETDGDETGEDDRGESRAAFRRRVHRRVSEGWTIEHDEGDSVVLLDRSLGRPGIHLLLFFLTGGFGNVVYGAYKYFSDADREVLRRGEVGAPEHPTGDGGPSFKRTAGGLGLVLLGALIAFGDTFDLSSLLIGWYLIVIGGYLLPQVRERFASRHSVTTFGKVRSTEESVVHDTDAPCSACMGPIDQGIERTYKQEQVFAGVPLYTVESGSNHYCRDCASGEVPGVRGETSGGADAEAVSSGDAEREREAE